jgi:hypothetical protein
LHEDWQTIFDPQALAMITLKQNGPIYFGERYDFKCTGSFFVFLPGYEFFVKYQNGTVSLPFGASTNFYLKRRGLP